MIHSLRLRRRFAARFFLVTLAIAAGVAILDVRAQTTSSTPDTAAPIISGISATNIAQNGATIAWNTNEPATRQVEYGATSGYGQATVLNSQSFQFSHSVAIDGLSAGTVYHYRVKSADSYGNTAVSGDYTVTTLQSAPAPAYTFDNNHSGCISAGYRWCAPQNGVGTTACLGTGTSNYCAYDPVDAAPTKANCLNNSGNSWCAGANGAGFCRGFSSVPGTSSYCPSSTEIISPTTCATQGRKWCTLSGVGNYGWCAPVGMNCYGVSVTAPDTVPPEISSLWCSPSSNGFVLTWGTNESATDMVEYGLTSAYGSVATGTNLVTSHSVSITGLQPGTYYHYKIYSTDAAGNISNFNYDYQCLTSSGSTPTATSTVTPTPTPTASPPPADASPLTISNLTVTDWPEGEVYVRWTTNKPADSKVQVFDLDNSTRGTATSQLFPSYNQTWTVNDLVTTHAVGISGLPLSRTFQYEASSRDMNGNVALSARSAFTIRRIPGTPQAPTGVAATVQGSDVTVRWIGAADADRYEIYWKQVGFGWNILAGPAKNIQTFLHHPSSYGTFIYRVDACNASGCTESAGTAPVTVVNASAYGSALDLREVSDVFWDIWGVPGNYTDQGSGNGIVLGRGLNYSTKANVGTAKQYGGKFVTSYSISGFGGSVEGSVPGYITNVRLPYLTQTNSINVTVTVPAGAIIEVWDLKSLKVIATNGTNPGSTVTFTAQPNIRYGGFAWYSDNAQKDLEIRALTSTAAPGAAIAPLLPPTIAPPLLPPTPVTIPSIPAIPAVPAIPATPVTTTLPFFFTPPAVPTTPAIPAIPAPPAIRFGTDEFRQSAADRLELLKDVRAIERLAKQGVIDVNVKELAAIKQKLLSQKGGENINAFREKLTEFHGGEQIEKSKTPSFAGNEQAEAQALRQMKQGIRFFEQYIKRIETKVSQVEKSGITIPADIKNTMATAKDLVGKVKAAQTFDDITDLQEQMPEVGLALNDILPHLEDLSRLPRILKLVERRIAEADRAIKQTSAAAKRLKLDVSDQVIAMQTLLAETRVSLASVKTGETGADILGTLQDNILDKTDEILQTADHIRTVATIRATVSRTAAEAKRYQTAIRRREAKKENMQAAYVLLDQFNEQLAGLKGLVQQKLTPEIGDQIIEYLRALEDAREELDIALGTAAPSQLENQIKRLFAAKTETIQPFDVGGLAPSL